MSDILQYFTDLYIDAIIVKVVSAPNGDGIWVPTPTPGATIQGIKYNLATTSAYRNVTWSADISDLFVTGDFTVGKDDLLRISGIDYHCEFPDDVAVQGEVNLIGLRRVA